MNGTAPSWLSDGLRKVDADLKQYESDCRNESGVDGAHKLTPIYRQTLELYAKVKASDLDAEAKAGLEFELGAKIEQFQSALKDLLGLDLVAFAGGRGDRGGYGPGAAGGRIGAQCFSWRRIQRSRAHGECRGQSGADAGFGSRARAVRPGPLRIPVEQSNHMRRRMIALSTCSAAEDATPTAPFFTRPNTEQPYYDISNQAWRERSFAPWPLAAWVEYTFDGLPIRLGQVVQTLQRITGPGGIYEPLVVTPKIGVRMEPEARILPLDGSALPVKVTVHAQAAADGTVTLKLPDGWHAEPAEAQFHLKSAGDSAPLVFSVSTDGVAAGMYNVEAVAHAGGRDYKTGWQSIGYPGLRPYNQYKPALLETRKVDVKVAAGLKVGYIMGPGDMVPEAIDELGISPHMLNEAELASGDYSAWNVR